MQVIETTAGQFYRVTDAGAGFEHVWNGIRVKLVKGGFVDAKNARVELVRKIGCRAVKSVETVEIVSTVSVEAA